MKELLAGLSGFGIGMVTLIMFIGFNPILVESGHLKEACEAQLPRDQHCVMQYMPEVKE